MRKILYFGIYDPNYSRTRILLKGLRQNGVEVVECGDCSSSVLKYIKLAYRYFRIKKDYDAVLVAFPGYQTTILIKSLMFLNPFGGSKPIIFDAFFSIYNMAVEDRKVIGSRTLKAKYYWYLDVLSCKFADKILLDTNANIDYFVKNFKIKKDKFLRVFVGTDPDIFYPRQKEETNKFLIHFHGHFIPLQGVEYIIKAAGLLKNEDIQFQIIGNGQEYKKIRKLADDLGLKDIIIWIGNVPYADLPEYISKADICLGGFGDTEKSRIVSMNKLFEYMACGKTIITGDGTPSRELLQNGETAIFCKRADAQDLADKILALKNNPNLIDVLGRNARKKFETTYTPEIIVKELLHNLTKV